MRASLEVLESISRALTLTPAERTHLLLLGRGEDPPPCKSQRERVAPTLRRLIDNLGPNPAYLLGRRWDYLAWNRAACVILGDLDSVPPGRRNHVWLHFMDPARRELFADWKPATRLLVAKFRADSAHHLGDPEFEQLIHALRQSSPEFCKEWKRHEVARAGNARKDILHPVLGPMAFEHTVLHPGEATDQRLVLYTPLPEHDTAAKLAEVMGEVTEAAPVAV